MKNDIIWLKENISIEIIAKQLINDIIQSVIKDMALHQFIFDQPSSIQQVINDLNYDEKLMIGNKNMKILIERYKDPKQLKLMFDSILENNYNGIRIS